MKVAMDAVALAKKYFNKGKDTLACQKMEKLLNTSARAGAGGTKAGLVGLRPNGMKDASEIVDYFTPGKITMPDRPFTKEIEDSPTAKRQESIFRTTIMLPRSYCADCGRTGRPESGGAINANIWTEERIDLGVKPGDGMISFFCQECCDKYKAGITDPGKDIAEVTVQGIRKRRQREQAERLVRCKNNQETYIHLMRTLGHMEIYTDGRSS
jgi:hypothetical protein